MKRKSKNIARLTAVKPSERQIRWQAMGFTAFLHFGINTFTNREWGTGDEDPAAFAPAALDTGQWCESLRAAGVRGCILTAKHHDGFCLWDTAYTRHSVMFSPVPVDIVASLARSCSRFGLKMGLYLSPWDRHEPTYGSGEAYDLFFCGQLEELTTKYGELYAIWFDGACGEGPDGRRQVYDWERYYAIIRKNQPDAVISTMGPDVRWIGNEAGITRLSEWSVVSALLRDPAAIAERSQQADGLPALSLTDADLGSAGILEYETELCWYPAEVDVSIRPGWFYHPEEDRELRTVEELLHIYETSVGGNAVLLLNVPPDTNGLIPAADTLRLKELGDTLKRIYRDNLIADALIQDEKGSSLSQLLEEDEFFWRGNEESEVLTITFPGVRTISRIVLCEQIRESQRISSFEILNEADGENRIIYAGTTVGFRKICIFDPVDTDRLYISITASREYPTFRFIGAYQSFFYGKK